MAQFVANAVVPFVRAAGPFKKIASQTTHATAGTRKNIAHGLTDFAGNAITPTVIIPVVTATAADTAMTSADLKQVFIVTADSTNVVVRGNEVSIPFDLYVA
jgi:enterochelin esterase-like enzyme